jgi:mannose/fructose/N-acetylgalactosamine-specific phosphotransferase system component IIC
VSALELLVLLLWGALVGLDLVSVPQMMIARPIVAGTVAGALLGDLHLGLRLGVVFELFQLDVLPVGAVRYPEYGPATVAAVATAYVSGGSAAWGVGAAVGLALAVLAGGTLVWLREANARAVRAVAVRLEAGDRRSLERVHLGGLLRDALRASLVTAAGLGAAWLAGRMGAARLPPRALVLSEAAAAGVALAAGVSGLLRLVGHGSKARWLAAGLAGGMVVLWIA